MEAPCAVPSVPCPDESVFFVRRLLAILLPALLLITACGGSNPAAEPTSQSAGDLSKLDSVKVTDNGNDKAPGVEFSKPLSVTEPTVKVVVEGDGERVKAGQTAELVYAPSTATTARRWKTPTPTGLSRST